MHCELDRQLCTGNNSLTKVYVNVQKYSSTKWSETHCERKLHKICIVKYLVKKIEILIRIIERGFKLEMTLKKDIIANSLTKFKKTRSSIIKLIKGQ